VLLPISGQDNRCQLTQVLNYSVCRRRRLLLVATSNTIKASKHERTHNHYASVSSISVAHYLCRCVPGEENRRRRQQQCDIDVGQSRRAGLLFVMLNHLRSNYNWNCLEICRNINIKNQVFCCCPSPASRLIQYRHIRTTTSICLVSDHEADIKNMWLTTQKSWVCPALCFRAHSTTH